MDILPTIILYVILIYSALCVLFNVIGYLGLLTNSKPSDVDILLKNPIKNLLILFLTALCLFGR